MKKIFVLSFAISILAISAGVFNAKTVNADDYSKSNIIDDSVFVNSASMTEAEINAFINSFPNSCLLPQNQPAGLSVVTFKTPIDYFSYGEDSSPAHIIWWTANYYGLNPQVILTTLEKEENLITGSKGCALFRYNSAMGYNCPDSLTYHTYADINIVNTCVERESNAGFSRQVSHATWQLTFDEERAYGIINGNTGITYTGRMTKGYRARVYGGALVYYDGIYTIDGETIYISNGATAALYNYTPHFNSFNSLFTQYFGSTYSNVYNGVDYSAVFDATYYLNNYPDLKAAFGTNIKAALIHFVDHGISEGRQAIEGFNVTSYMRRYYDLRHAFGNNMLAYCLHYINNGKSEGRIATGDELRGTSTLNGVDYSSVYNFNTYLANYPDIKTAFGIDDIATLTHFVDHGISEGRQAIEGFNVFIYQARYEDLHIAFGDNLKAYYLHYINNGKSEGRIAI